MAEVIGTNNSGDAVRGTSNNGGTGVRGIAKGAGHNGVVGQSTTSGHGVGGFASRGDGTHGESSDGGAGARGIARGANHDGVVGESTTSGHGVLGVAARGDGLRGDSKDGGAGVRGIARGGNHDGVVGQSLTSGHGVLGVAARGNGVFAESDGRGHGVYAIAKHGTNRKIEGGVDGLQASGAGAVGVSTSVSLLGLVNPGGWHPETGLPGSDYSIGVCGAFSADFPGTPGRRAPLPWDVDFVNGLLASPRFTHIGVYGMANIGVLGVAPFAGGTGVVGCNTAGGLAAAFSGKVRIEGDVEITGDLQTGGGDCAERFPLAEAEAAPEPGTVMAMDREGRLTPSATPYDRRVAGVVSGAGALRPGLVLGHPTGADAQVALVGRVMCKVEARSAAIAVGDLVTSSAVPGHAMKAADPARAFGAVIGKAMAALDDGEGMIPILVMLR